MVHYIVNYVSKVDVIIDIYNVDDYDEVVILN